MIVYFLFGLCTTVVNLITFKIFNLILGNEKYLISNPSQVFAVMKKAPYLMYDAEQDCFNVKDLDVIQLEINGRFRSIEHIDNLELLCNALMDFINRYVESIIREKE